MIRLSEDASWQLNELVGHYLLKHHPEAVRNLDAALSEAMERIAAAPDSGLPAPRPYPEMARPGHRWIKAGRYWFCYDLSDNPLILAILDDQANMPQRR